VQAATATPAGVPTFADKEAFYGDLHLHTTNSFDAYVLMAMRTTPEDAYRFAAGETIDYLGQPIRRAFPARFPGGDRPYRKPRRVQPAR